MGDCLVAYLASADENCACSIQIPHWEAGLMRTLCLHLSRPKSPNFSQYVHCRAICDHSVTCTVDQEGSFAERFNIVDKIAGGWLNSLQVLLKHSHNG